MVLNRAQDPEGNNGLPEAVEAVIRSADPRLDQRRIAELYAAGLMEGDVVDDDLAVDIDDLNAGYFGDEGGSHFWVAEWSEGGESEIIGTVGVQRLDEHTAELRRLRVDSRFRNRGIGKRLIERALSFCEEKGYLKVVLDTRLERGPAIGLFERYGFVLNRTREINGKVLVDFYLDLYRGRTSTPDD